MSGSGPAYVFLLAEELARAGIAAGLPAELATKLARDTVSGSGELLHRSDLDCATLRKNVTSPGGTTAAALEVLMGDDGFAPLLTRAVAAATHGRRNWRSSELANGSSRKRDPDTLRVVASYPADFRMAPRQARMRERSRASPVRPTPAPAPSRASRPSGSRRA